MLCSQMTGDITAKASGGVCHFNINKYCVFWHLLKRLELPFWQVQFCFQILTPLVNMTSCLRCVALYTILLGNICIQFPFTCCICIIFLVGILYNKKIPTWSFFSCVTLCPTSFPVAESFKYLTHFTKQISVIYIEIDDAHHRKRLLQCRLESQLPFPFSEV